MSESHIRAKTNKKKEKLVTLPSLFTLVLDKVTIPRILGKDFAVSDKAKAQGKDVDFCRVQKFRHSAKNRNLPSAFPSGKVYFTVTTIVV